MRLLLFLAMLLWVLPLPAQTTKPDLVEVMEVNGTINQGTAAQAKEQVEKFNDNPKVKAVLLVVNSPGGGALASNVLYQELSKIKVPVVALCEYLCASGGVYAIMAPSVKFIAVRPEAISGSVGVIALYTRYNRLLDWAKIDVETFKSGPAKDAGNPTRAMTPEDKKHIQSTIDDLAAQFYEVVLKGRPNAKMEELKQAGIFIGKDAIRVGLADAVMSREEAVKKAKELSGSKLIFTREELKKMSKAAGDDGPHYKPIAPPTDFSRALDHVDTLMGLLEEIRAGDTVRYEYRLREQF